VISRITGIAILLSAVLCTAVALPYVVSDRYYFRDTVGSAEIVVLGRVVATTPYDRSVPERSSTLLVELVFGGTVVAGDSLLIRWAADTWYPQEGCTASVACGANSQLEDLHGQSALWLINLSKGPHSRGGLRCSLGPYVFSSDSRVEIERLLGLLEAPKVDEQGAVRAADRGEAYVEPADAPVRWEKLVAHLKDLLKESDNGNR
jgi:hypothetical protein